MDFEECFCGYKSFILCDCYLNKVKRVLVFMNYSEK